MDSGISATQTQAADGLTGQGTRSRRLNALALVAGSAAAVLGPLAGGLFILLSLMGGGAADAVSVTSIGVSMAALGLGLGGALAWTGYQGLRGRPSHAFRPGVGWVWICAAGWVLAVVLGQVLLWLDVVPALGLPVLHVLGTTLPAAWILILAARGLKNVVPAPTRRQVIGQLAWGAFGTTLVSFSLEAVAAVMLLIAVAVAVALTPGGLAQLGELQALLADPAQLADPGTLADWLLRPWILLPIAVMLVILAPLIEEAVKSLGVPLLSLGNGARPSLAQGWLWGMAAGAGFAITEGLFNSAASLPFWAGIVLLRVGATAMHMVSSGLTGLGWARTLAARRALPVLGSYLASVTLHGLWNGLTVLIVAASLWTMARPGDPSSMAGGGLAIILGLAGLCLLVGTMIGLAVILTLRLGRDGAISLSTDG